MQQTKTQNGEGRIESAIRKIIDLFQSGKRAQSYRDSHVSAPRCPFQRLVSSQ